MSFQASQWKYVAWRYWFPQQSDDTKSAEVASNHQKPAPFLPIQKHIKKPGPFPVIRPVAYYDPMNPRYAEMLQF